MKIVSYFILSKGIGNLYNKNRIQIIDNPHAKRGFLKCILNMMNITILNRIDHVILQP
jgi:hypothetical protein